MRILQISPQVPYPLLDGGKVSIFNITKYLARRGHEITFLALDTDCPVADNPMREFCEVVTVPHSNKNSVVGAARNLFSSIPYNVSKYQSSAYLAALTRILKTQRYDIVHVDYLHMAHYGLICRERSLLPIVLREHDVTSTIMERFAETLPFGFFRFYIRMQVHRIRKYEGEIAGQYDLCCAMTETDKWRLKELYPATRVEIIPAGVDASYFASDEHQEEIPDSISFVGKLDWIPNRDAIRWFLDHVFPLVRQQRPNATLYVIGQNRSGTLLEEASKHVVFRGFVPDLRKEIQRYSLTIAPLRIGGGMRMKIIESFAMRVPVVSTSVGCEGISAVHGQNLLIADRPDEFASHVVRLMTDGSLRDALSANAFDLAERQYRWEVIAEKFENCYEHVLATRKTDGTDNLRGEFRGTG